MISRQNLGQLDLGIMAARRELTEKFLTDKMKNRLKDEASDIVKRLVKLEWNFGFAKRCFFN